MSNFFYEMNQRMAEMDKAKEPLTEGIKGEIAGGIGGALAGAALGGPIGGMIGGAVGAPLGRKLGGPDEADQHKDQLTEIAPALVAGARLALPYIGRIAQALGRGAATTGRAAADVAGKAATGIGRGTADVAKSLGQSAAQNATSVGMGVGVYELAKTFAEKLPAGLDKVYTDVGQAAADITSSLGKALDSKTVLEIAAAAVKYAIPLALLLGVLYGGKKLIDKALSESQIKEDDNMRDILDKLDNISEGWKGTAAGAGLGSVLGGPLGAAAGALAGDKIGDEMEEGSTGDYSARKARAGKDIGKPGKAFAKIAKGAAERYGSKERGEKVAGAVLAKLRKSHPQEGVEEAKAKPFSSDDYDDFGVRHSSSFNQPPRAKKGSNDGNLANNAKPYDKVTRGDVVAGRLGKDEMGGKAKDVKEGGRDMTPELTKRVEKASGGKESLKRDTKGVLQVIKKKASAKKVDEIRLSDLPKRTVKGRAYGAEPEEFDQDHDIETDMKPKKSGRKAVGAGKGKKIGMKIPGRSKLLQKGSIREDDVEIQDRGEYDMEGSHAKDDIHNIMRDIKALHNVLADDENLPEWVQAKMSKAEGMISSVRDYMLTQHEREGEQGMELDEKAVSVAQRRAAGIAHAAQKGEIPKSKLRGASKEMAKMAKGELHKFAATKEKGLPKKKSKEEVEETTVSGSVATAPAPKAESAEAPKKAKGSMQFGKGIYDSMNRDLEAMISESMSINISSSTEGGNSVTVTATDEDAAQLKELLKRAGIGDESHSEHACPACGQEPCGCAEVVDENQPEWPTNTETSLDALQYSGGLNKPKTDVAGAGQTVMPTTAVRVQEGEDEDEECPHCDGMGYEGYEDDEPCSHCLGSGKKDATYLDIDESKCMECGMYEDKCECDKPMDESLERIMELAGVQEAAKPDFLDGDRGESMKKAAQDKETQDDKKVEESILSMRRLWQEYKG